MTDDELTKAIAGFRKGLLGSKSPIGMCFMVCWPLSGYLHALGVNVDLNHGWVGPIEHCWLTLPDGRIIDPTADQFTQHAGTPVYIGPKPSNYEAATG